MCQGGIVRRGVRGELGSTTLECAIALPLFLLCVAGIIEFSRFTANRSQIETALRKAGEYAATLDGDCLRTARDRFFEIIEVLKTGSELSFTGDVVPLTNQVQALRLVVTGTEPSLLQGVSIEVRSVGFFPIEVPNGCQASLTIQATSRDWELSASASPSRRTMLSREAAPRDSRRGRSRTGQR